MKIDFSVEETVKNRNSVRTYEERPLSLQTKQNIREYMDTLSNPFSVTVAFRLLEVKTVESSRKLGTYGMIKGASEFIGATVMDEELALEALGYEFEKLILYATSLGLGTCWLGGTFKRSVFANAMEVKDNELFPAISPIGYSSAKMRLSDVLVRKTAKSDHRYEWNKIFYNRDFSDPLTLTDAGEYAFPLEMLRLAPSASNKQPWQIVQTEDAYHFYKINTPGYGNLGGLDIQRVDIGIGACHFHMAALEKGLSGRFQKLMEPDILGKNNRQYIFSWIKE